ncbi:MAG: FAD-dependent oxidoreductase [Alphaproteobacteria bacterium]|nr:FAD-dependent oxidoreductase [Alphaproteobacteria bacterium]
MADNVVIEPERRTPVIAESDVVVLGGGPAGVAAATAAARHGASVILIERYGFLGGMGTAAMVTNFCGLHAMVDGEIWQVVHGLADEILDRLKHLGGLNAPHNVLGKTAAQSYDVSAYKLALDDLIVGAGVTPQFHALAVGAVVAERRIHALLVETKSKRGAIVGRQFIDCSGDADLAHWAGAPYEKGGADGAMAYPTLMFKVANVDSARATAEGKPRLAALMARAEADGTHRFPRRSVIINPQHHAGQWRVNATQISRQGLPVDGSDGADLTFGEIEGRRQVRDYFAFLRRYVPGFEASYLLEIAPQIGVRETRRIIGAFQLDATHVLACADFDDAIGVNGWPVEKHVKGDVEWRFIEGRGYHQIPYRVLLPQGIDNLLVAGRCASATQDGQASLRVSGPCFVMGQAAGTAAAMAVGSNPIAAGLDIGRLQDRLAQDGVFFGG